MRGTSGYVWDLDAKVGFVGSDAELFTTTPFNSVGGGAGTYSEGSLRRVDIHSGNHARALLP